MKSKKYVKAAAEVVIAVTFIFCAIKYSHECSQGVYTGILLCVKVLVPSLFVFMIIASLISQGAFANIVNKVCKYPTKKIFKLPQCSAFLLLLSIIGGYPVGAKGVDTLYKNNELTKEQAKKLSLICVCASPAFCINFVALSTLKNFKVGIILFVSQVISFLAIAFIVGQVIKTDDSAEIKNTVKTSSSLIDAVIKASASTINMCAMVIAFSAFVSVCEKVLKNSPHLLNFLVLTSEVSLGVSKLCVKIPLHVLSFVLGFGGVCVHFQIFSILRDLGINKYLFFLFRILQGIIAGVVTYILLIFFPVATQVFSTVNSVKPALFSTVWGGIALVFTAVCFVSTLNKNEIIRR